MWRISLSGVEPRIRLARKGVLTLTQLAHTFRPRRKGKRAVQKNHKRYHALQALAIRDRRIYVFGTPEVPKSPVRIYLDVEGVPDEGFVFLIGMIVCKDGEEKRLSFWADRKDQEGKIFQRFLDEATTAWAAPRSRKCLRSISAFPSASKR